jgi:hypothetical protein
MWDSKTAEEKTHKILYGLFLEKCCLMECDAV